MAEVQDRRVDDQSQPRGSGKRPDDADAKLKVFIQKALDDIKDYARVPTLD